MTNYSSNVSDSQWAIISNFLDTERKRKYELREIVNAIMYLVKTGCQWRLLPSDFPHWKSVYYYFSKWNKLGIWEEIHNHMVREARQNAGKESSPSVGIIDSQTVKSSLVSFENKGFDAAKKINGIKRHIIVDTMGFLLSIIIHEGSLQDRDGARQAIKKMKLQWSNVIKIFADSGYRGKLIQKVKRAFKIDLEIIQRNEAHTFQVLPKRWIVERTFAWIDANRRNSKNYERLSSTNVAMVQISAIRIMKSHF